MQVIYILLCIAGAALPLSQFAPWLSAHGLNVPLLLQQATSSHIAAFAWADVLVSALWKALHKADYAKPAIMESGRSECPSNTEGQRQASIPTFT